MLIRLHNLELYGDELVGEDEDTEYFIMEYLLDKEHLIYHKAEVFYPETLGSGYYHNLN
jgi:hypothetical protein